MALNVSLRALILLAGIVLFHPANAARATEGKYEYRITGVEWHQAADGFQVAIHGEKPPTYTVYELFNPLRIVLDIADAGLADSAGLPVGLTRGPVSEITGRMLNDQNPFITRIEMVLAQDLPYHVERDNNNVLIKFDDFSDEPAATQKKKMSGAAPIATADDQVPSSPAFINDVLVTTNPDETRILLQTGAPILKHKRARLPNAPGIPDRLYIDIPDIRMNNDLKQINVGSAVARIRMAHRGSGLRVVFDSGLDRPFPYEIKSDPQGLLIIIPESAPLLALLPEQKGKARRQEAEPILVAPTAGREKIEPLFSSGSTGEHKIAGNQRPKASPTPPPPVRKEPEAAPVVADGASFAGYDYQKITVDFFKIDLHNVFRLIGEISGHNIVVDEAVSGTLTLALSEVPWDFVLDVVLNLKNLQKEERYNTIVISPKNKEFNWPKRATDQLAIKKDGTIAGQEAITIKQRLETPPETIEAKKLIHQGNDKFRTGDYQAALSFYEEGFAKWPENKELAERIASMALVHLGMNAKAVHYAKAVLELDPLAEGAALHAAIGLANMKRTAEAKSYFDLAISGNRPNAEALLSYAAFCEENDSYQAALTLLARHEQLYGNTLESMIAKARLYDQLGRTEEAGQEYRAILLSGFSIPADLKRYINGRMDLTGR
jgi:type IV pilus assembly protein PilQ